MPIDYSRNDRDLEPKYKYSPFRNIGPQEPYELKDANGKRREDCRKQYEGQIYHTKQGYDIEIVDYMGVHNVMVRFVHDGYMKFTEMSAIKKGLVAYPFHPNKYGGYPGVGYYNQGNSKFINGIWFNMLERCYGEKFKVERYRMYDNVTVCPEWFNFQNFAFWYDCYRSGLNPDPSFNYQLDKDILQQGVVNKIYSPQTCCLIPRPINSAFECMNRIRGDETNHLPKGVMTHKQSGGVVKYTATVNMGEENPSVYLGIFDTPEEAFLCYKKAKEDYIHSLADQYIQVGAISKVIYNTLYSVDIKPFSE